MEAQTSKKQYQAIAPVSRFDLRSSVGAQTKAVDPVSRFRWALSFPGIAPAAGKVLAALADHADQRKLTCFPSVETLARETQVSERGVRYALRKLEAAGAILTERSRGRSSSLYRLMIPPTLQGLPRSTLQGLHPNPARIAPPNPARIAPPNPARIAPLNPARIAPQQSHSSEQSNKELLKQQQERAREASDEAPTTPAAAAAAAPIDSSSPTAKSQTARHTCPKCERTWPKQYGAICHKCQHDVDRAQRREEELAKLAKEMEEEDRPVYKAKPQAPHVSETALKEYKRAQAELPEIEDSLKAIKDALFRTG